MICSAGHIPRNSQLISAPSLGSLIERLLIWFPGPVAYPTLEQGNQSQVVSHVSHSPTVLLVVGTVHVYLSIFIEVRRYSKRGAIVCYVALLELFNWNRKVVHSALKNDTLQSAWNVLTPRLSYSTLSMWEEHRASPFSLQRKCWIRWIILLRRWLKHLIGQLSELFPDTFFSVVCSLRLQGFNYIFTFNELTCRQHILGLLVHKSPRSSKVI